MAQLPFLSQTEVMKTTIYVPMPSRKECIITILPQELYEADEIKNYMPGAGE